MLALGGILRQNDHQRPEARGEVIMIEHRVKVITGVRKEAVQEGRDGRLVISVRVPREEGRANMRVCELLALYFSIPVNCVHIVRGQTRSSKIVRVFDCK